MLYSLTWNTFPDNREQKIDSRGGVRCEKKSRKYTYLSKSYGSFQDGKWLKACAVHHYGKLVYKYSRHKLLKITDSMHQKNIYIYKNIYHIALRWTLINNHSGTSEAEDEDEMVQCCWRWSSSWRCIISLQTNHRLSESSQGGHFILFIHLAVYKILNVENVAASRLAELHGKRTKFIS